MDNELIDEESAAAALAEWHRRWVEEPERFVSEWETAEGDGDDYGQAAARYLFKIVRDIRVGSGYRARGGGD